MRRSVQCGITLYIELEGAEYKGLDIGMELFVYFPPDFVGRRRGGGIAGTMRFIITQNSYDEDSTTKQNHSHLFYITWSFTGWVGTVYG